MLDINLNLYRIFYIVAQSKSYSDASNKLNISKTAISKYIKKLEDSLNVKLFYRESSGVALTIDGKELFEYVDKSLTSLEAGEKLVTQKNDLSTGEISIGSLSHISMFYLMPHIQKIKQDYENLNIKITTGSTGKELVKLLETHKIDFALDSTHMDILNKEVQVEKIKDVDNIFVSNKQIIIKDLKELENYNYILGLEYTSTSKSLVKLLKDYNINIKSTIQIDITELKTEAVKRGLGIGYVMKDAVQKELENKELYEVKIPIELPKSELHIIYLKGQLTKASKKFIKDYLKK